MDAPMFEVTFACDNVNFSVCFHREDAIKMLEEGEYMKSFFTELRKNADLWAEIGLPTDVDINKIKLLNTNEKMVGMQWMEDSEKCSDTTSPQQDIAANILGAVVECTKSTKVPVVWNDGMIRLLISTRLQMDAQFNLPIPKTKLWAQVAQMIIEKGFKVTANECHVAWRDLSITFRKNKEIAMKSGDHAVVWPYFSLMNNEALNKSASNSSSKSFKGCLPLDNIDGLDHEVPSTPTSPSALSDVSELSASSTSSTSANPSRSKTTFSTRLTSTTHKLKRTYNSRNHAKRLKNAIMKLNNNNKSRNQVKQCNNDNEEPPEWMVQYMEKLEEANKTRDAIEETRWNALAEREDRRIELEEKKLKAMYALIEALKK